MTNNKFIPIYEPWVAKNQKAYILDCVDSNMYSFRGKYVEMVEGRLAGYLQVPYLSTTFNGSVSLMLILSALGIKYGDEVITQSLTYAATVFSIFNVGATPVLIDSDVNFQMNIDQIEGAITKKTKALIVAQLYGSSPDMIKLKEICDKNKIHLIEDSAEVFGCSYGGKKLGSFGVASSFSWFSNKVLTMGSEGGSVVSHSYELRDKLNFLRGQGHLGNFIHQGPIAFNFRCTNIQCAILLAQLEEVDTIIAKKRNLAKYYRDNLTDKITRIVPDSKVFSTEWLPLFTLPDNISYEELQAGLKNKNIDSRPCFTPAHLMPGFDDCRLPCSLEVSEDIYKKGFNLPSYPALTEEQLKYIVDSVNKIVDP